MLRCMNTSGMLPDSSMVISPFSTSGVVSWRMTLLIGLSFCESELRALLGVTPSLEDAECISEALETMGKNSVAFRGLSSACRLVSLICETVLCGSAGMLGSTVCARVTTRMSMAGASGLSTTRTLCECPWSLEESVRAEREVPSEILLERQECAGGWRREPVETKVEMRSGSWWKEKPPAGSGS